MNTAALLQRHVIVFAMICGTPDADVNVLIDPLGNLIDIVLNALVGTFVAPLLVCSPNSRVVLVGVKVISLQTAHEPVDVVKVPSKN